MYVQDPVLDAVALPRTPDATFEILTVVPAGAVPLRVMVAFELAAPLLMTGAAGRVTLRRMSFEAALVPLDVESVAVKS